MFYEYSVSSKMLNNIINNRVLLLNPFTGKWIKMSKECFGIIECGIKEKICLSKILYAIKIAEDREYMNLLLSKLIDL